jgi:hypothetical protein
MLGFAAWAWSARPCPTLGDSDESWPEAPVVNEVAGLHHIDDCPLGDPGILHLQHRLLAVWIERLTEGVDAPDPVALKRIQEFPLCDLHSIQETLERGILAGGFRGNVLDGAAEIIANGQEVAREVGHGVARCLVLLLFSSAPQIFYVGHGPKQPIAHVFILGDQGLELRVCLRRCLCSVALHAGILCGIDRILDSLAWFGFFVGHVSSGDWTMSETAVDAGGLRKAGRTLI